MCLGCMLLNVSFSSSSDTSVTSMEGSLTTGLESLGPLYQVNVLIGSAIVSIQDRVKVLFVGTTTVLSMIQSHVDSILIDGRTGEREIKY